MSADLVATIAFLGTPVAINIVIGWIEANWDGFLNLNVNLQQVIKVVVAIVMAFGSNLALQYVPSSVFDQLGPYWKILYATLTGVFGQAFGLVIVQWRRSVRVTRALAVAARLRELGVTTLLDEKLFAGYLKITKGAGILVQPGVPSYPVIPGAKG